MYRCLVTNDNFILSLQIKHCTDLDIIIGTIITCFFLKDFVVIIKMNLLRIYRLFFTGEPLCGGGCWLPGVDTELL